MTDEHGSVPQQLHNLADEVEAGEGALTAEERGELRRQLPVLADELEALADELEDGDQA